MADDAARNYPQEISKVVSHPSIARLVRGVRHYPRACATRVTLANGFTLSVGYRSDGGIAHGFSSERGTAEVAVFDRSGRIIDAAGGGMGSSVLPDVPLSALPTLIYRYGRPRSRAVRMG